MMKQQQNTAILWNSPFILLMISNLFVATGTNIASMVMAKYAISLKGSAALAGIITGLFSIAALISRPLAGKLVDLKGKRSLCIAASMLIALTALGYAFAQSTVCLLLLRTLHGLAFALNSIATIALAVQCIPKARLGEGVGLLGIGQVLAQIIGPSLSVALMNDLGFRSLFYAVALINGLSAMLLFVLPAKETRSKPPIKKRKSPFDTLLVKEALLYALTGGLFSFANGIVSSFMVLLGQERSIPNISLFFAVNALVLMAIRLFFGRIADRVHLVFIVNISLALTALSLILIGFSETLGLLLVAGCIKAMGQGTGQIALQMECLNRTESSQIGIAMATYYMGADIGQGLGPMFGGWLLGNWGYTPMYVASSAVLLISMPIFTLIHKAQESKAVNFPI